MKIEIKPISEDMLELYIDEEDYSVADIIRYEILKNKDVIFAGLTQIHPLSRKFLIKIRTKDTPPLEVIVASGKNAIKNVEDLLNNIKKVLKEKVSEDVLS